MTDINDKEDAGILNEKAENIFQKKYKSIFITYAKGTVLVNNSKN